MVPEPPPTSWKPKGIFLQYLLWEPRYFTRSNIVGCPPGDQVPLEVFTLRLVCTEPPAISQSWRWPLWLSLLLGLCSGQLVAARLCLQSQGQQSALRLASLWTQEERPIFQSVQLFTCS